MKVIRDQLFVWAWIVSFALGTRKYGGPVGRVLGSGQGPQCLVLEDSRWVSQPCSTSVSSSVSMGK